MTVRYETLAIAGLDECYASLRLVRPEVLAAVRHSVERHGVLHPILVNAPADGRRLLLDGFKRVAVLRELGTLEVAARVVELGEAAAQAAMITTNTAHRGLSELEEAWVVRSLVRTCKLRQIDVAELVGRHKSWVCRRLLLAEGLDDGIQQDMRLGLVSASVARELARLPRGNQAAASESVRRHGLTSRQAATLVERCLVSSSVEATSELLADPLTFLKPSDPAQSPADPRLGDRGERVRRCVVRLTDAATTVCMEVRKHPFGGLRTPEWQVLRDVIDAAEQRTSEALGLMGEIRRSSASRAEREGIADA